MRGGEASYAQDQSQNGDTAANVDAHFSPRGYHQSYQANSLHRNYQNEIQREYSQSEKEDSPNEHNDRKFRSPPGSNSKNDTQCTKDFADMVSLEAANCGRNAKKYSGGRESMSQAS